MTQLQWPNPTKVLFTNNELVDYYQETSSSLWFWFWFSRRWDKSGRLNGANPAEIHMHFSTISYWLWITHPFCIDIYIPAKCSVTSAGTWSAIISGGCILGQRDAIQRCPLLRTLDDSPRLHSWEHLFCVGSFKPAGFWLGQRQPHPTSRRPPPGNPAWLPQMSGVIGLLFTEAANVSPPAPDFNISNHLEDLYSSVTITGRAALRLHTKRG